MAEVEICAVCGGFRYKCDLYGHIRTEGGDRVATKLVQKLERQGASTKTIVTVKRQQGA